MNMRDLIAIIESAPSSYTHNDMTWRLRQEADFLNAEPVQSEDDGEAYLLSQGFTPITIEHDPRSDDFLRGARLPRIPADNKARYFESDDMFAVLVKSHISFYKKK